MIRKYAVQLYNSTKAFTYSIYVQAYTAEDAITQVMINEHIKSDSRVSIQSIIPAECLDEFNKGE